MADVKIINQEFPNSCGYIGFFNGRSVGVYATSLSDAKDKLVAHFKPKKSQRHMVHAHLAQNDKGEAVVHVPVD